MKYCLLVVAALVGCGGKSAVSSRIIHQLVFDLEYSSCVIIGGVGITGKDNPAADAYKTLLRIAPDSVWVRLSYSEKPVVRMYAFEALLSKKSPDLERVKNRLKKDTATVCEIFGDVSMTSSIGELVSLANHNAGE
ncbi:hypothetical protein [Puia dinghuensis]|uniref:Uncharacterized protein n=1 Tax=Puia dinghuensis TaxID=1792502 RepID=A0A8J2XVN2_9BACT|nr:hypothetical protein [Puia dinghuensis]GGB19872.1 hypothetical protein GCM10011511_49550 [Puia dinghuensis]